MNEDVRHTLPVKGDFLGIIRSLYASGEEANILYDDGGLTRAGGRIIEVNENTIPYLVLGNNVHINIHTIVAVNGTFAADYSEC